MHMDPCSKKGECEMLSGSDPSQAASAPISVDIVQIYVKAQAPWLESGHAIMNDHQFIPRPRQRFGFIGGNHMEGQDGNGEEILA